jgi:hypothetical protein
VGTDSGIALRDEEQELLALEVGAILPALTGAKRERYEALAAAVDEGTVPDDVAPVLEAVLELALQTGRARRLYRAEGERLLTAVFRRTPRGRELASELDTINKALRVVAGETLDSATVRMRTLGHFTITLSSPAATLTLAVRPDGVAVESVAVGEARSAS